jgi:hypothetical protein
MCGEYDCMQAASSATFTWNVFGIAHKFTDLLARSSATSTIIYRPHCLPEIGSMNGNCRQNLKFLENTYWPTWFIYPTYPYNRPWRPTGLWDVKIPRSLDIRLTDGGKVVSLTHSAETLFFWYPSLLEAEGLGNWKRFIYLIAFRTRDLSRTHLC